MYHHVKGLLRNKDINDECEIDVFEMCFKKIILYGAQTWIKTKKRR